MHQPRVWVNLKIPLRAKGTIHFDQVLTILNCRLKSLNLVVLYSLLYLDFNIDLSLKEVYVVNTWELDHWSTSRTPSRKRHLFFHISQYFKIIEKIIWRLWKGCWLVAEQLTFLTLQLAIWRVVNYLPKIKITRFDAPIFRNSMLGD